MSDVILSPYSLFTILLISSAFMLLFVLATYNGGAVLRLPLWSVYAGLAAIFARLLIPVEIDRLSYEVTSYGIMARLNNAAKLVLPIPPSPTVGNVLIAVWAAGAVILLCIKIKNYIYLCLCAEYIPHAEDERIARISAYIYRKYGFKGMTEPKIVLNKCIGMPSEFGSFKQTIFIDEDDYTDKQLYYIILHEFAHYRIGTNAAKAAVSVLASLLWWDPVVWLFCRHFDKLMELYVDKFVTSELDPGEKSDYLACLLYVYKKLQGSSCSAPSALVPMSRPGHRRDMLHRFSLISSKKGAGPFAGILMLASALLCCALTVFVVFQPGYEPGPEDLPPEVLEPELCEIVPEGGKYILYYDGEELMIFDDKQSAEQFIK